MYVKLDKVSGQKCTTVNNNASGTTFCQSTTTTITTAKITTMSPKSCPPGNWVTEPAYPQICYTPTANGSWTYAYDFCRQQQNATLPIFRTKDELSSFVRLV